MVTAKKDEHDKMLRTTGSNFRKSSKGTDRQSRTTKSKGAKRLKSQHTYKSALKEKESQSNLTDEVVTVISQRECKHTNVERSTGNCANCKTEIAQFGSVFDTGTIKSYIKVLYVDESKKPVSYKPNTTTNVVTKDALRSQQS